MKQAGDCDNKLVTLKPQKFVQQEQRQGHWCEKKSGKKNPSGRCSHRLQQRRGAGLQATSRVNGDEQAGGPKGVESTRWKDRLVPGLRMQRRGQGERRLGGARAGTDRRPYKRPNSYKKICDLEQQAVVHQKPGGIGEPPNPPVYLKKLSRAHAVI